MSDDLSESMARSNSVSVLFLAAWACGCLAGLASLRVFLWKLPPSDEAHGMSLLEFLSSSFLLAIWLMYVALPTIIGFAFAVRVLPLVSLSRALPIVTAVSAGAAAAFTAAFGYLGGPFAVVPGVMTMYWCRDRKSWRLDHVSGGDVRGMP